VFTRCLTCNQPFPRNEELEHFSRADRVAFDPDRGRLWAICRVCKRWSLSPIRERWEALEELEKAVRDGGKTLSQTDNIALLRIGELEVVRVGRANLTEESWWRYGREIVSRKASYRKLTFAGTVAAGAAIVGGWASGGLGWLGAWLLWEHAPGTVPDAARWLRFGGKAWRGEKKCRTCGYLFREVRYRDRGGMVLIRTGEAENLGLTYSCPNCGEHREGGLHLTGQEGQRAVRKVLAYHHFEGAHERRVRSATRLIEEAGSPRDLTRIIVRDGCFLSNLQRTGGIALEIAANESVEQRMLEMELAELEAVWRREEELAAIVDGELTPLPLLEQMRVRVSRHL